APLEVVLHAVEAVGWNANGPRNRTATCLGRAVPARAVRPDVACSEVATRRTDGPAAVYVALVLVLHPIAAAWSQRGAAPQVIDRQVICISPGDPLLEPWLRHDRDVACVAQTRVERLQFVRYGIVRSEDVRRATKAEGARVLDPPTAAAVEVRMQGHSHGGQRGVGDRVKGNDRQEGDAQQRTGPAHRGLLVAWVGVERER